MSALFGAVMSGFETVRKPLIFFLSKWLVVADLVVLEKAVDSADGYSMY